MFKGLLQLSDTNGKMPNVVFENRATIFWRKATKNKLKLSILALELNNTPS